MKYLIFIFYLFLAFNHKIYSNNIENKTQFYVQDVKRISDLDKELYYFKVILNNQHYFEVKVSLEDLLNQKIYTGMEFQLLSEEFIPEEPSYSYFNYFSVHESVELKSKFDSISSHWSPKDSLEIIELTKK